MRNRTHDARFTEKYFSPPWGGWGVKTQEEHETTGI